MSAPSSMRRPTPRATRAEVAYALAIAVVLAAAARLLFQPRMLIDGAGLATFFGRGDRLAHHFLYLPACRAVAPLARLVRPEDPIEATRILSAVAFGVGTAFTFLFVRELGQRWSARAVAFGTFLVALSPAALFFATTVEVHALNYATVAFAAWATLRLPWARSGAATAGSAGLFGLVFWAHQIDLLLGPGWVLLCAHAARRAGRPLSRRALVLGVGPALLGGAVAASAVANWLKTGSMLPSADDELGILTAFLRPPEAWRFGWDGWLAPLALVVPFALFGFVRGFLDAGDTGERGMLVGLATLVFVPTAFLFAWGVSEHGGYALGHAPFLAALVTAGATRVNARLADLALAAQAALALALVLTVGRGFDVDARAELVRAHLAGATFVATAPNAPSITLYIPDAFEVVADDVMLRGHELGLSDADVIALVLASARAELARTGRLVFDLGYQTQADRTTVKRRMLVLEPVREALEAEFKTTRVDDESWPLLIVESGPR
jgi:hypothetical protein